MGPSYLVLSLVVALALGDLCLGANVEEPCNEEADECVANSQCREGYCICNTDYVPAADKKSCLPVKKSIGLDCIQDNQCVIKNAACRLGLLGKTCQCEDEFVSSLSRLSCLPVVEELKLPCTESQQCQVKDSKCDGDVCECAQPIFGLGPPKVPSEDRQSCLTYRDEVEQDCEEDVQCGVDKSSCVSGKCKCDDDLVANYDKDKCLEKTGDGEKCEDSAQCPTNSTCAAWEGQTEKECILCYVNCKDGAENIGAQLGIVLISATVAIKYYF